MHHDTSAQAGRNFKELLFYGPIMYAARKVRNLACLPFIKLDKDYNVIVG